MGELSERKARTFQSPLPPRTIVNTAVWENKVLGHVSVSCVLLTYLIGKDSWPRKSHPQAAM